MAWEGYSSGGGTFIMASYHIDFGGMRPTMKKVLGSSGSLVFRLTLSSYQISLTLELIKDAKAS
jgi:hypothetical protein